MTITENQVAAHRMNGFTSGTQALQDRKVNHDPEPWVCSLAACTAPQCHRLNFKGIGGRHAPRLEFAVPDNPILVAFREYATINKGKASVARFADEYLRFRLWGRAISDQTVISHAIRVLTKLAAGMHLDGPVRGSHLSRGESSDHE